MIIPLFIWIRELSPCRMVHGEDWVLVSGRVGDFARGEESFNFIPCFLAFKASRFRILSLFLRSVFYHIFFVSKIYPRKFQQITKPVYFVDSHSGLCTQTGTWELLSCMSLEPFYFYKASIHCLEPSEVKHFSPSVDRNLK